MKRLLAITVLLAAVGIVVVLGTGADSGSGDTYKVRAIFRNAFSVIPGEDVKIAGVKVGKIDALDVTKDHMAAVVLRIDDPGFQDFRKDGTCTIRPQSLIGEKFVECTPTQPHAEGEQPAPKLDKITDGDGKGQYLLPVEQTRKPVDIDLLNNIMRLPYRERFTIILNELGVGLTANGDNLRQAVRAADPALEQLDNVLKILADQNRTLADLARNGDEVLRPLARDADRVGDFIVKANITAQASAERRDDIEANIQRFPAFLRELTPTMTRLGALTDQITPIMKDLGPAAPDVNTFVKNLGPLSQAGIPAFQTLGDAADAGRSALVASKPIVGDLQSFATQAKPLVTNLSALLTSTQKTGGIERLMDLLFYQASAINGYDALGHYLRAILVVNTCSDYFTTPDVGCRSTYTNGASAASAAGARKARAANAKGRGSSGARSGGRGSGGSSNLIAKSPPATTTTGPSGPSSFVPTDATGQPATSTGAAATAAQAGTSANATTTLLDYLLGG